MTLVSYSTDTSMFAAMQQRVYFSEQYALVTTKNLHPNFIKLYASLPLFHSSHSYPAQAQYDDILKGDDFDYSIEAMQDLETLHLELRDFNRVEYPMDNPHFLPNLRRLSICSRDAMAFLDGRPIAELTLEYPTLFKDLDLIFSPLPLLQWNGSAPITFLQATPGQWLDGALLSQYLPQLETAVVLQDGSWTNRHGLSRHFPALLKELVHGLSFLPNVETLVVLTRLGSAELLLFQDTLERQPPPLFPTVMSMLDTTGPAGSPSPDPPAFAGLIPMPVRTARDLIPESHAAQTSAASHAALLATSSESETPKASASPTVMWFVREKRKLYFDPYSLSLRICPIKLILDIE
ncbi:hypothetical protein C8J57DRAFT_1515538 [Mycena rebaudengoi]|nr:hypothetical protein C8J57DRAFT_1515538 [Mycena rebaudengoi]